MNYYHKEKRKHIKSRILESVTGFGRPVTVGELFLDTGESHTMINRCLKELLKDGIVKIEIKDSISKYYNEKTIKFRSALWSLSGSNGVSPKKK